jgi:Skp family chaperone for outer membrane proteins
VAALGVLGLTAARGEAQSQLPPGYPGIRVIDIKRVFDEYGRFKAQIAELRDQVKAVEEQQKEEQRKILEMEKGLPELRPGSPERKDLEKKIFQLRTDLGAQAKIKQAEFMEKEAKIYHYTYQEIQDEVKYYCKVKNVSLVLMYSSEKPDPNNRASIMRAMTSVVVHQQGIDITDVLLRELNRRAGDVAPAKTRGSDVSDSRGGGPGRGAAQR